MKNCIALKSGIGTVHLDEASMTSMINWLIQRNNSLMKFLPYSSRDPKSFTDFYVTAVICINYSKPDVIFLFLQFTFLQISMQMKMKTIQKR
jgi:hypothetical protein